MELIAWFFALLRVMSSATPTCDTPVMFTENSTKFPYEQESLLLVCNASSYDQINWFHEPSGMTDHLNPFPFSWCKPNTCILREDTMLIREISMALGFSKFFCIVSCSATGKNTSSYASVIVAECVPSKPILLRIQNVTASLGETATLTCKAQMGTCYKHMFSNYIWVGNGKNISELNTTNRYSTDVKFDSSTGDLVTTLTIRDVTEDDLQSFDCILIDDHFTNGNDKKTVFLSHSESSWHTDSNNVFTIVSVIVSFFIIIAISGSLCYCLCCWRIQFFWKKKELKERGGKKWDVLLWHDVEHSAETRTLLAALEEMGYRVCTKEDRLSGSKLQGLEKLIESSACVIILRKDDGMMMTVLDKAQENQSVVLIQTSADRPPQSIIEKIYNLKSKCWCHTRRDNPPKSSVEINKSMAGFLKLYWPLSHDISNVICCGKLLKAEFYYRLRLKLPKQSSNIDAEQIQML